MKKLTKLLEKYLLPLATKLGQNKILKSINSGMSSALIIIITGALFTLAANLNIGPYQSLITAIHLKEILAFVPKITTDMLAVYMVFLIGKATAENIGIEDQSVYTGTISLFIFFLMIPLGVSAKSTGGETVEMAAALGTTYLGAAGLFSAMILGLVVPHLYKFLIGKNIVIKMPESVPPGIAKSFKAILPTIVIGFLFAVVRYLFTLTSFDSMNNFVYSILKAPLTSLGASPFTFIIFIAMCSLMWFFGLHGGMVVMPFLNIIYLALATENLTALNAGEALPNIIVQSDWITFASLGGAGGTLGLCVIMAFMAKSERYKALGKMAIVPGICGINEPVTFGLPLVLNTVMLIPFVITPIVTFSLKYFLTYTGILPHPYGMSVPLGTPVIMSGILAGGWKYGVFQVFAVLIQICIYLPFFKVLDAQALKEEGARE